MKINLTSVSRALSRALRHTPWLYELELDEEGWAPISDVLASLRNRKAEWGDLTAADLTHAIESSKKRRHEIRDDKIRALYGHSIAGKLKKTLATPPDVLFHGTSPAVLSQIRLAGLMPMKRQYVHLSTDEATALEVGRRKSKTPVILQVMAKEATANSIRFYEGNENVWLADTVPPEFLIVCEQ